MTGLHGSFSREWEWKKPRWKSAMDVKTWLVKWVSECECVCVCVHVYVAYEKKLI